MEDAGAWYLVYEKGNTYCSYEHNLRWLTHAEAITMKLSGDYDIDDITDLLEWEEQ